MTRLTESDLYVIVAWWDEGERMVKSRFERVDWRELSSDDPEAFDEALLQRLADWLDQLLRERPELLAFHLDRYLAAPSAGS